MEIRHILSWKEFVLRWSGKFKAKISLIFLQFILQVLLYGHGHGGCVLVRRLDIQLQTGFCDSLACAWAERCNDRIILLELREILEKGFDTGGTEKDQHLIVWNINIWKIACQCLVNNCFPVKYLVFLPAFSGFPVCGYQSMEAGISQTCAFFTSSTRFAKFSLLWKPSFPVLDILLQIICRGFGNAEVFHGVRNLDTHFLADPEKWSTAFLDVKITAEKSSILILSCLNSFAGTPSIIMNLWNSTLTLNFLIRSL